MKRGAAATAAALAMAAAGCGEFVRESRSPSQLVIEELVAAPGATPEEMGGTLFSDVETRIDRPDDDGGDYFSIYADVAEVAMRVQLRDPGVPGVAATPTAINSVTLNRYRVSYRRADGRNTPGVDVPYPFDSAITLNVTDETSSTGFEIVRHAAKLEPPLSRLVSEGHITTIADVTFYGRDQAGNDVAVTGSIGITFGNFADPD